MGKARAVRAAAVLVVLALGGGPGMVPGAAAATGDPRSREQMAADLAAAKAAVLELSDLPDGWSADTHIAADPSDPSASGDRQFAQCVHGDVAVFDPPAGPAGAYSDDFSLFGDGTDSFQALQVLNHVELVATPKRARGFFDAFARKSAPRCLAKVFQSLLDSEAASGGPAMGSVQATRLHPVAVGDAATGLSLSFSFTQGDLKLDYHVDIVVFIAGRAEVTVLTIANNETFPPELARQLVVTVANRLGATT